MPEKNKKTGDSKEKEAQHNKSTDTSREKKNASKDSKKNIQQTGTKFDDWNDPTGNSHLGNK